MLNFDWLAGLSTGAAKGVIIGVFFIIGGLVLLVRESYVFESVAQPRWWLNLKYWAIALLGLIAAVYLYL